MLARSARCGVCAVLGIPAGMLHQIKPAPEPDAVEPGQVSTTMPVSLHHLSVCRGDQQHFVRRDELRAAWSIFTPLLHAIDNGEVTPDPYMYGSRGPASLDAFLAASGYKRSARYVWKESKSVDSAKL